VIFSLIPKQTLCREGGKCYFLKKDLRDFVDSRQFGYKVAVNHKFKLSLGKMAFFCYMTDLQSKIPSSRELY
jgi:hypothetical protein